MANKKHDFSAKSSKKAQSPEKINEIICILDGSGSMSSQRENTISGFNNFLMKQKEMKQDGVKTLLSVIVFREGSSFSYNNFGQTWSNQYGGLEMDTLYNRVDISEAPLLQPGQYKTDNGTPLFDCIGQVLTSSQITVDSDETKPHSILVVIFTDGEENTSKTWNKTTVSSLINSKKAQKWNFLFLGADLENFSDSYGIGLGAQSIKTTGSLRGYNDAWACVNNVAYFCNSSVNGTYTDAQLNASVASFDTMSKAESK